MKTYSELVANDIMPVFRSLLAYRLKSTGISQERIASIIRVSQPAVSQYLRGIRAPLNESLQKNEELMKLIGDIANAAPSEGANVYKTEKFMKFCTLMIEQKLIPNTEHIDDYMKPTS